MRVISGFAGGRKLISPKGEDTRPTSDKVREAVFNILGNKVQDAVVLDLFAGSGAMGIEALSRNAKTAVFVDINHTALLAVKKNLENTGLLQSSVVKNGNSLSFLKKTEILYDIIFIDPPYNSGLYEPSLKIISEKGLLSRGGLVVLESSNVIPHDAMHGFKTITDRKYGSTFIAVLEEDN